MSVMHIFSIAEDGHRSFDKHSQFRCHANIPWDEAYELYLDPPQMAALVKLARAAQGNKSQGLQGRVFDVMRETLASVPAGNMAGRDHGPYALVTSTSVWTRIELEQHLLSLTPAEWTKAHAMGQLILQLARGIKE